MSDKIKDVIAEIQELKAQGALTPEKLDSIVEKYALSYAVYSEAFLKVDWKPTDESKISDKIRKAIAEVRELRSQAALTPSKLDEITAKYSLSYNEQRGIVWGEDWSPKEDKSHDDVDLLANFGPHMLDGVEHQYPVSLQFATKDGLDAAYAEMVIVIVDGEIVNGSIYTRTKGGAYYHANDLREAIKMAKDLVEHWNQKDWNWQPKEPT